MKIELCVRTHVSRKCVSVCLCVCVHNTFTLLLTCQQTDKTAKEIEGQGARSKVIMLMSDWTCDITKTY